MSIRLGTTSMNFFQRPILEAVELIAQCGFESAELWADHAWDERRGASVPELKQALARLGLQSTIHCPIMDLNIASPNRGVQAESVRQVLRAVDLAGELGSELIVIHPGHKYSPLENDSEHWERQVEAVERILAYAQEQKVLAAVENLDSDKGVVSVRGWPDLERLFQDCKSGEKWVTLDVTHLKDTEQVLDFINKAGPHLAHLHLSDSSPEKMHLCLGEGSLDLKAIAQSLKAAGYQGICSLECFIPGKPEQLREELLKARALFA